MGDLTPAQELRDAAEKLREAAKHAAESPWTCSLVWSPDSTSTSGVYSRAYPTGTIESEVVASGRVKPGYGGIRNPHNAVWITLMQPDRAEPLADLLDSIADGMDELGAVEGSSSKAVHSVTVFGLGAPNRPWTSALVLARQINGTAS